MKATLHQLLIDSAKRVPDRTAIEDPALDASISYGDLDAQSDALSALMVEVGVKAGDRVGLCVPKTIGTVISLFAAMKAGGVYVPAAYDAPPERNAFIYEDCTVAALIVDCKVWEVLETHFPVRAGDAVRPLGDISPHLENMLLVPRDAGPPDAAIAPEVVSDLSYILYTSGSTGKPKGVIHTHASALSFVDLCSEIHTPTEADRFSSHAPFHFDLSIHDIYVPLKHGATLVLINDALGKQPIALADVLEKRRISVWYSTPSILRMLVEFGKLAERDCSNLRAIIFAGEVFPVKHLRALWEILPEPRYLNFFGPTETNVCTWHEVIGPIPDDRSEPYPIGKVSAGDVARVVDAEGKEVVPGEEGELLIAGGTVMVGYWNLPERNALAFVEDEDGRRWHCTGDVVRLDGNGDYIYMGRRDRMVKRRGYRVELGEIEAALYRHPSITEAAAIAIPDEESGVHVKAFICWSGEGKPSIIALKQFCTQHLSTYMIPDSFSVQPELPKTSTDKVDYQALKTYE